MITTVTFNPSLDYIIRTEHFEKGEINRTTYEKILAGGKGINVSIVLANLEHRNRALGFLAGFTGKEIERQLNERGIVSDFIWVKEGLSRINVKLKSDEETEINGQGPKITEDDIKELFVKLDEMQSGDCLIISGSIPNTLPSDMYERIMEHLEGRGIRIVVDATKDLLTRVLKYKPFLIKPNHHELSEIFHTELHTVAEIVPYAKKLQEMGAVNVLVSMGKDGAMLLDENGKVTSSAAPKGELVNSVGAGDSMVAGFLAGYLDTGDYAKAFYQGLCAGSASAFSEDLATKEEVEALLKTL